MDKANLLHYRSFETCSRGKALCLLWAVQVDSLDIVSYSVCQAAYSVILERFETSRGKMNNEFIVFDVCQRNSMNVIVSW